MWGKPYPIPSYGGDGVATPCGGPSARRAESLAAIGLPWSGSVSACFETQQRAFTLGVVLIHCLFINSVLCLPFLPLQASFTPHLSSVTPS